jgi:hypothetical protein
MANKCYNLVSFFGSGKAQNEICQLFEQFKKADELKDSSLIPVFSIAGQEEWMFDINISIRDFYLMVTYDTNWYPNMRDIARVANRFDVTVMHDYEDLDMSLYGKYIFTPGRTVQSVRLEISELCQISHNNQTDEYMYNGYHSQCLGDIADIMLFEKISKLELTSP